ncbi:GNAT family N-acetyltransferase [Herbiconiux daphne]|uniref:GNAT family N-acetyltransferase n=1 Tax=Herbiconiux daphne TaxID=2970914 RepID=A0ABT2H0C6_9MICO|nr:GNAT family N-acetyltransferase [Herbiconiux daphne]MCS5733225.1 GNAT family N-acetyltransferase [Herbiconiux daphne]
MGDLAVTGIRVVPANEASVADLEAVFGTRGTPAACRCQWFKHRDRDWQAVPVEERAANLREQSGCGHPHSPTTSGLIAYRDDEPAGWCAVEPRTAYQRLLRMRVPWAGRDEDRADDSTWAVTCFVVRTGFRRQGVSRALAAATVDFARSRGARALEGYPMVVRPGQEITWGELYVGSLTIFEAAGFTEITRPTPRRAVVRIDF